ncbi:MAG: hypothetical protein AB2A00_03545 [Myxococcota bacterium]
MVAEPRSGLAWSVALVAWACRPEVHPLPASNLDTGVLLEAVVASGGRDVRAVRYEVRAQPCADEPADPWSSSTLVPAEGAPPRFPARFLATPAGCHQVQAVPLDGLGGPAPDCGRATVDPVVVRQDDTTRVTIPLACDDVTAPGASGGSPGSDPGAGESGSCGPDRTAPHIQRLAADPEEVRESRQRRMREVEVDARARDACDEDDALRCYVSDLTGGGEDDREIVDALRVRVRAEDPGRRYRVEVTCADEAGNAARAEVAVTVVQHPGHGDEDSDEGGD